jgi:hypothetical protein
MAICCVSEKIQTAYVCPNTLRVLDFFASLHLTIFEQAANFEFFNSQLAPRMSTRSRRMTSCGNCLPPTPGAAIPPIKAWPFQPVAGNGVPEEACDLPFFPSIRTTLVFLVLVAVLPALAIMLFSGYPAREHDSQRRGDRLAPDSGHGVPP